jgi:DNA-binding XRE family transcriptional regulator
MSVGGLRNARVPWGLRAAGRASGSDGALSQTPISNNLATKSKNLAATDNIYCPRRSIPTSSMRTQGRRPVHRECCALRNAKIDTVGLPGAGDRVDALVLQLLDARKRMGLEQSTVAHAACVSPEALSLWESGDRVPSLEKFQGWANALGFELTLVRRPS